MKKIKFIDVHVHGFLKPADKKRFKENITILIDQGLEKIIITALPYHDFAYHLKLSLAPDHIQPVIDTDNVDETTLLADWTRECGFDKIVIPFIDVRFLTEKIRETIRSSKESGYRGIKGAFIPEPDRVLNIQGIPQALGISIDSYCRIQEEIFMCAHELDLPLLYHINLSQYCDWIATLLKKFPLLTINIPHLGYSLRKVTEILKRFDHAYTDPSYLISLLKKNNRRYLSFISTYYRKILSGSDAIITGAPGDIIAYPRYFDSLSLPEASKDRILRKNAHTFLSLPT
jgi:hypothetical protein